MTPGAARRRWRWRWRPWRNLPDDDLLEGFDRTGQPRLLQVFFATTIAGSLLVWDLAFALGAYHTVFYSRLFQILVVSTVLLVGSVILRKQIHVRPWMQVLLGVPLLWLVARTLIALGWTSPAARIIDDVTIGLIVVSIPFTLLALARVVAPEYFALPTRRLKVMSVSIIAIVALTGFLVGQFNYVFTTCENYVLAGDDQPTDCRQVPSPSPSPSP